MLELTEKKQQRKTREQAIHWTNLFINSVTTEDAKSLLFGLIGAPSIEGLNRWLWSQGIGGCYHNDSCTMFCNEVAARAIVEKALTKDYH